MSSDSKLSVPIAALITALVGIGAWLFWLGVYGLLTILAGNGEWVYRNSYSLNTSDLTQISLIMGGFFVVGFTLTIVQGFQILRTGTLVKERPFVMGFVAAIILHVLYLNIFYPLDPGYDRSFQLFIINIVFPAIWLIIALWAVLATGLTIWVSRKIYNKKRLAPNLTDSKKVITL